MPHVEIPKHWLIGGEVPAGTLAFLVASVYHSCGLRCSPGEALELRIEIERPLSSGRVDVDCGPTAGGVAANLSGPAGDVTLTARAIEDEVHRVDEPALGPDDLLPYQGGTPGAASLYEVRPLPVLVAGGGRADAWVRCRIPTSPGWSALTALDAWATPTLVDRARSMLHGLPTDHVAPRSLRHAEVVVSSSLFDRASGWLLRLAEHRCLEGHSPIDVSTLASRDGEVLATCTSATSAAQESPAEPPRPTNP